MCQYHIWARVLIHSVAVSKNVQLSRGNHRSTLSVLLNNSELIVALDSCTESLALLSTAVEWLCGKYRSLKAKMNIQRPMLFAFSTRKYIGGLSGRKPL